MAGHSFIYSLFESLNDKQRNYILAYGSYCFKRPRHKDLIIRWFTVYPTQVGSEWSKIFEYIITAKPKHKERPYGRWGHQPEK